MNIRIFQQVSFETPGQILKISEKLNWEVETKKLFEEDIPRDFDFDILIIMGGPMSIFEDKQHPFLAREKQYISEAIDRKKKVIGICLGAQLIANTLGARVYHGREKEIGWFPIEKTDTAMGFLPDVMTTFHWHGDTFDIPEGAIGLYKSEVTPNQAFLYNKKVLGLQFHMEMNMNGLQSIMDHCKNELAHSNWVMTQDEILHNFELYHRYNHKTMENLLKYFSGLE